MSTNDDPRPRTREILVDTVQALRADDHLARLLYDDPPADTAQRQKVHEAWGGPEGTPGVELVVEPIASGGSWYGGPLSKTTQLQCSTVATERWRSANGITAMRRVRDRVAAVLESPVAEGVYPAAGSGQESPLDTPDESNRMFLPITAEVRTHHMTY